MPFLDRGKRSGQKRRRRLLERARDERFGWGASGPVRQGGNCTLPKTSAPYGLTNVQPPFFATVGHRQPLLAGSTFHLPGTKVALALGRYIASSPETQVLPPRRSRRPSEGKARPTKVACMSPLQALGAFQAVPPPNYNRTHPCKHITRRGKQCRCSRTISSLHPR